MDFTPLFRMIRLRVPRAARVVPPRFVRGGMRRSIT
jgi:hypothetical protein